ncbi:hypothetical protein ACIQGT_40360 [Streptomyces sp. NPDC093108]|uniref:hypothetical protein n=1 Tax=Streptomyces sp. NPDC093108 TaxID=3366030 RepID=UPI0037F4824B
MTKPDDGEQRIRSWLRRKIDGPAEAEQSQPPLVEVHVIPELAAAADDDQDDQDDEPEQQPEPPWWSYALPGPFGTRRTPEPEPSPQENLAAAPGIHVTVNQPPPQQWAPPPVDTAAQERRHRRRMWLLYHGSAAAVGWFTGLAGLMSQFLVDAGRAAPGVGVALGLVTYIVASYLPGLPYMPPALRPVMVWAARIPVCTAALALALNAPGHI